MIGFGELRRWATQWNMDLTIVERVYATDWLIAGLGTHTPLADSLMLYDSSALRYAHCADYPIIDLPAFLITRELDAPTLMDAIHTASLTSGLKFMLSSFNGHSAKVEYSGPLGRRSAAQPRIMLSFTIGTPHLAPIHAPLIHRFSDPCPATVAAITLTEIAAERLVAIAQNPRARDVFDLWFTLTHAPSDLAQIRALAQRIAQAKNIHLDDALFAPAHRANLARVWDQALRNAQPHPPFAQVEHNLNAILKSSLRE